MNSAKRPDKPRRLTQGELVAIALLFVGIRVSSNHLSDLLLSHFSH
ncbi:MAG: hypothetical protein AAF215_21130 [Cyanobacteria bacterium P01_A01_bin.123]